MINRLTITLLCLIGILLLSNVVVWDRLNKVNSNLNNAQSIINNLQNDTINYKRNSDSTISAYKKTLIVKEDNIKALLVSNKDILAKVKLKNLQGLQQITFITKDSFVVKLKDSIRHIDSVIIETIKFFDYTDNYLTQHCEINDSGFVECSYQYQDSVTVLISLIKKYKWWQFWKYGKKESITEVIFNNPRSNAIKINSILIK